jgi:hypothetical protein
MGLRNFLRRLRLGSVQAEYEDGHQRSVDNIDALTAAAGTQKIDPIGGTPGTIPPNYVKQDDGRPRH